MTEYSALEKMLGPAFLENIAKIKYDTAGDNKLSITHMAEISLPVITPVMSDNIKRKGIGYYEQCFSEAVDVMHIQAIENFAGIEISKNFCGRLLMEVMSLLNKALFNDPLYTPHMESFNLGIDNIDQMNKCVFITATGLVVKKDTDLKPSLYWFANSHTAIRPPENMSELRRERLLESKAGFD